MQNQPVSPIQIVCDFDGTITAGNVMDFIATRFATCGLTYSQAWDRGEISTREEFKFTFATISASLDEMVPALAEVVYDPALVDLVQFSRARGIPFSILSDGLRWYIEAVLRHAGVEDVFIYANEVYEESDGFSFTYPWYSDETPRLAMCKPDVLRDLRKQGKKIVYIGDGPSDFAAVHFADMVYAKPALEAYCREQNIACQPFQTFADIIANWRWLDD